MRASMARRMKMSKKSNFRLCTVVAIFFTLVSGVFFSTNKVFANIAENWSDTAVQKALLQGLHRCYSTGAINFNAGKLSEFKNFNQLVIGGTEQDYVALPSGLTSVSDNNLDCESMFQGRSSFKGIFELAGKPEYKKDINEVDKKVTFLEGMGYSKADGDNKKCVIYYYTADYEGKMDKKYTDQVCYTDENGLSVEDGGEHVPYFEVTDKYTLKVSATLATLEPEVVKFVSYTFGGENSGWNGFVSKLNNVMSTYYKMVSNDYLQFDSSGAEQNNYGDAVFKLKSSRRGGVADKALSFLSSYKNYDGLAFTDTERLSYLVGTIKNWFYSGMSTNDYLKCDISDWSLYGSYLQINIDIGTMKKSSTCGIDTSRISGEKYAYGFSGNHFDASGATKLYLTDVVKEINTLAGKLSDEDLTDISGATDGNEDGETEPTCMNTAATSLGWILCPVLDAFGGATDWAYNELVKPALQIEPQLFTGGNEGTQRAWETFRSIANVFFIILFLVVIFSQLTGVGIDNYGIKKILPKLILAAVLINLSYLICIIFVDVSNILGNGLQNIFTDLGSQLSIPDSLEGGIGLSGVAQSTLTSIVVLIALIGGVATAITAAGGVVAFLVSLLIIALSALVALFFLFLLLAAREAAIIVLIVLSPLAFACYILPNTQNTFKKWYQLGWRLLMVYPIAGLLIGGGDFVSKLLLSAGVGGQGFFSAFAAIIAGIIPIFFIPTVLKQAFALMGGLGAKISGLGKSVGGRISGNVGKSIQGSERFKNYQADRERNRKLNFARRTNERLSRRNSETLSGRQRRQLASARMIESAEYAENLKRDAIVDDNRYEAMRAGIRAKDEDQAINDRLALMRSSGEGGGVTVGDQKVAYTLDNLNARMQELERKSRSAALSSDEQSEMAALARGMVSQKGGAGMLNNIVRNAGNQDATGKHQLNANFMSSLGQIYNNDSTVASKMTEKDGGMGGYMERFMPGGDGVSRNESFDDYRSDTSSDGYVANAKKRIKSHEAGLNQSGEAFRYYLGTLTKDQAQSIMDNQSLLNSLDVDNRTEFISRARILGVTGPSARDVNVINVPHTP